MAKEPDPKLQENLLFGILGEANGILSREQLIAALERWVQDKTRELKEILVEQRAVTETERQQLEPMVALHIQRHGNDPAASLEALSGISSAVGDIRALDDTEIAESLNIISAGPAGTSGSGGTSRLSGRAPGHADLSNARFHIVSPAVNGGGLGVISIARDNDIRREVAVKQIRSQRANSDQAKAQFLLEAEITGLLEHPGIVPVYGLGHDDQGRPFYAMRLIRGVIKSEKQDAYEEQEEYETLAAASHGAGAPVPKRAPAPTPGKTLHDAIREYHAEPPPDDALTLPQILRRFLDVCHAVHYAHTRDILHRDLKPKNIMLGQHGETLVIDWGLACVNDRPSPSEDSLRDTVTDPSTGSGSAVGTPGFMSPEQAAGLPLDVRTDIYSLGATLYSLLTGRTAYSLADIQTDERMIAAKPEERRAVGLRLLTERILAGKMTKPREVRRDTPRALEAICLKAMASNPEDRYRTVAALSQDVERWLDDQPVLAWKEPLTAKVARQLRKHPRIVAGTTAALLVGLILSLIGSSLISAQKKRAEDLFAAANQAVETYFTDVSQETLLNEPGMLNLRTRLLQSASDFFEKLANDPGARTLEFRREQARAFRRLGRVEEIQENKEKAKQYYLSARQIQQSLRQDYPHDLAAWRDSALTETALGRLEQLQFKNPAEAEKRYSRALSERQQITQRSEATAEDYRLLGNARMNLAQFWRKVQPDTYSIEKAREQLQLALTANKRASELDSAADIAFELKRDLVKIQFNKGENESIASKRGIVSPGEDSLQLFTRALGSVEELVQLHPKMLDAVLLRSQVLISLADALKADPAEGLKRQEQAYELLSHLVRQNPGNGEYLSALRLVCEKLANRWRKSTRKANDSALAAEVWFRVQAELTTNSRTLIDYLSLVLQRAETPGRAWAFSQLLDVENNKESAALHYLNAHAAHQLALTKLETGEFPPAVESAALATDHIDRAIVLKRAECERQGIEPGEAPVHYQDLRKDAHNVLSTSLGLWSPLYW